MFKSIARRPVLPGLKDKGELRLWRNDSFLNRLFLNPNLDLQQKCFPDCKDHYFCIEDVKRVEKENTYQVFVTIKDSKAELIAGPVSFKVDFIKLDSLLSRVALHGLDKTFQTPSWVFDDYFEQEKVKITGFNRKPDFQALKDQGQSSKVNHSDPGMETKASTPPEQMRPSSAPPTKQMKVTFAEQLRTVLGPGPINSGMQNPQPTQKDVATEVDAAPPVDAQVDAAPEVYGAPDVDAAPQVRR